MRGHIATPKNTNIRFQSGKASIGLIFLLLLLMVEVKADSCILDQALLHMQEKHAESLCLDRSKLRFSNGESVSNCLGYYEWLAKKDIDESVNNQLASSEYLSCDVLKMLDAVGKMCAEKDRGDAYMGKALSSRLNLRSFPSSLFMASDEEKNTLDALFPASELTLESNAVLLDADDWSFYMEVVAMVDANENGMLDWVVWVSDEAKQGNYRSYFTLLVYDPGVEGLLVATPFSEYLRSKATGKLGQVCAAQHEAITPSVFDGA